MRRDEAGGLISFYRNIPPLFQKTFMLSFAICSKFRVRVEVAVLVRHVAGQKVPDAQDRHLQLRKLLPLEPPARGSPGRPGIGVTVSLSPLTMQVGGVAAPACCIGE